MGGRRTLYLISLVLLIVSLLAVVWEFVVEDLFLGYFDHQHEEESFEEHWEYVITSVIFAGLALVVPGIVLHRIFNNLEGKENDLRESRDELDLRVRERTAALSAANARLSNEIEDSRLTQDALHESEERFRLIAETSPVAMFISAIEDGTILFCNAAAGDLLRVPHEELIGRRVTELYKNPADRLPLVKELEEKGEFRDRPLEIVTRDGENRWVTLSGRRITFEGKPAFLSAIVDTTDRRRAEQQLRESGRRYRDVVEGEATLIVRFKPDTTFTFVNTAYAVQRQTPPQKLIGRKFIDFLPDDEKNELFAYLASFAVDEPVKTREIRARQPDGSIHWRAWTHRAFFDENGDVAEFQAVGYDVTERKRAEEALRESEERFSKAFQSAPVLIAITHPEEGRFHDVNDTWLSTMGYTRREVIGKTTSDLAIWVDPGERSRFIEALKEKPAGAILEARFRKKNGDVIDGLAAVEKIDVGGEARLIFVTQDITERKRAEKALRESEERFRDVAEASSDWFWEIDGEFRYTYFSDRVKSVTGKYPHHLIGKTRWESASVDRDEKKWRAHRKDLEARRPFRDFRYQYETTDGRLIHILASGKPVFDAASVFKGYRGSSSNITERVRAEEALRDSEQRYRDVVEGGTSLICQFLPDTTFTFVNKAYAQHNDVAPEKLIGRKFVDGLAENGKAALLKHLASFSVDKPIHVREGHMRRADGSDAWAIWTNRAYFDKDGNVSHFQGVGTDITERKQAEEALRESRELLSEAIESMGEGFVLFDEEDRLVLFNSKYAEMFPVVADILVPGLPFEKLVRAAVQRGQFEDATGREEAFVDKRMRDHRNLKGPIEYRLAGGRWVLVEEKRTPKGGWVGVRTDITEIKRAEEALRESEERFRGLFEGSIQGIVITKGLEPIFANQSYAGIFGYDSPRDVVEMESEHSLVAPADQTRLDGYAEARMRGEEAPSAYEFQGVRKDGSLIWLENQVSVVAWHGEPVILSTVVDVTERKRAEEALRDSERQLQDLIDGSLQGILVHKEHKPVFVSDVWAALHGYTVQEVMEMDSIVPLIAAEDRDRLVEYKKRRLKGGEAPITYEYRAVRKDGSLVWMMNHVAVIDWKGETAIQTAVVDISERKRAEEVLKNSEKRFRNIADALPVLIADVDADGRYRFANKHYHEWFDVTKENLAGQHVRDVIGDNFYSQAEEQRTNVLQGKEVSFDHIYDYGNGRIRHVHSIFIPQFETGGEVSGYYSLVQDLTERKRAEVELRAAMELADAANRAKSDFLSNMSHELRTPLNAILGFGQLLDLHPKQPLQPQQKEYVGHILEGGTHLLNLIDEVLELSKIESGVMAVSTESVALRGLFRECLTLIEPLAETHGIRIAGGSAPDAAQAVHADFTRLKQVLLNLLSNAVKYNRPGGTIRLESVAAEAGMVRLAVADTGFGIPKDKQEDLFTPFARLGAEGTNIQGTGIGLAFTKRLVALMDGRIGFESTEGVGSTFWVELPRAKAKRAPKIKASPSPDPKSEWDLDAGEGVGTLLYVEDNPANQRLMEGIVERVPGLRMASAPNAELGLEVARKHQPDVIVMDIDLPGMDGFEALKRLKGSKITRAIPVIALSANALPRDVERGIEAGFNAYLSKPFEIAEILRAAKKALANSSRATPAKASKKGEPPRRPAGS